LAGLDSAQQPHETGLGVLETVGKLADVVQGEKKRGPAHEAFFLHGDAVGEPAAQERVLLQQRECRGGNIQGVICEQMACRTALRRRAGFTPVAAITSVCAIFTRSVGHVRYHSIKHRQDQTTHQRRVRLKELLARNKIFQRGLHAP
jgi:hypothetical protein